VGDIVRCKRAISADTALRLGIYFGHPAQFWLNLQNEYDLRRAAASPTLKKLTPRAAQGGNSEANGRFLRRHLPALGATSPLVTNPLVACISVPCSLFPIPCFQPFAPPRPLC
jgi:hypothetical protein